MRIHPEGFRKTAFDRTIKITRRRGRHRTMIFKPFLSWRDWLFVLRCWVQHCAATQCNPIRHLKRGGIELAPDPRGSKIPHGQKFASARSAEHTSELQSLRHLVC